MLSISIVSASQHDNDILNKNNNMFLTPQNNADLDFGKSIGILRCNDLTLYPTDDFTVRIIDDHLMPLEGELLLLILMEKLTMLLLMKEDGLYYLYLKI